MGGLWKMTGLGDGIPKIQVDGTTFQLEGVPPGETNLTWTDNRGTQE